MLLWLDACKYLVWPKELVKSREVFLEGSLFMSQSYWTRGVSKFESIIYGLTQILLVPPLLLFGCKVRAHRGQRCFCYSKVKFTYIAIIPFCCCKLVPRDFLLCCGILAFYSVVVAQPCFTKTRLCILE